jgi:hypothetical protein
VVRRIALPQRSGLELKWRANLRGYEAVINQEADSREGIRKIPFPIIKSNSFFENIQGVGTVRRKVLTVVRKSTSPPRPPIAQGVPIKVL